jgi:DNA modification methylase
MVNRMVETDVVYLGNFLDGIKNIDNGFFDLIIADPPYRMYKDFGNESDQLSYPEFMRFSYSWIDECLRVLKSDGTMMIYGRTYLNWFMWGYLRKKCSDPDKQLKELVWFYTNKPVPRMNFYQPAHENIIVFLNDPSNKTFNKDDVRQPYESNYANHSGRVRPPTKGRFGSKPSVYNVNEKGAAPKDVLPVCILNGGVIKSGTLAGGSGKERIVGPDGKKHPSQKPEKLTSWLIKGSSNENDTVLIPFSGSGTEALVSRKLNRRFVGFELNENYIAITESRFSLSGYKCRMEQRGLYVE